jgi:hypothetical protein
MRGGRQRWFESRDGDLRQPKPLCGPWRSQPWRSLWALTCPGRSRAAETRQKAYDSGHIEDIEQRYHVGRSSAKRRD